MSNIPCPGRVTRGVATNHALPIRLAGKMLRAKLAVGPADDSYEREADAVADQVMRMPAPFVQRKCASSAHDDETVHLKPAGAPATGSADTAVAGLGRGSPLPASERAFFEPRLGRDLGDVRVHTDTPAAPTLGARAFALGRDVAFAPGQWQPGTVAGRGLLAHELVHVLQQDRGALRAVRRQVPGLAEIDRRIAENEQLLASGQSFSAEDLARLNAERNALLAQQTSVARGGSTSPRPVATPSGTSVPGTGPTVVPTRYSYRLVGTVPILGDAPPLAISTPLPRTVGSGSGGTAPVVSGTTGALGASVPVFLNPLTPRTPIPAGTPNVYTRFVGPETVEGLFDPGRLTMQGDLRPRLFQGGNAAQQEAAFAIFEREGIRYAQLSELRRAMLSRGVTGLTSEELALLRQVTAVHARISGATPVSPLISLTELMPEEALARLPPTATNRAYVVRVQIPAGDVARVNQLLPAATETLSGELEVVVARDLADANRVRILSVNANPSPSAPLGGMVGPVLTWVGRGLMVLGAGIAAYQVVTASGQSRREWQGRAFGGFAGGVMLGAFGAGLCVGLGVATAGLGLLACGLAFGALGAWGGSAAGGAVGRLAD